MNLNTSVSSSLTMNESSMKYLNNTLNTSLKDKKDETFIKKR